MNTMFGIDLAKRSLHILGMEGERVIKDAKLSREKAILYFANQPAAQIFMEACGGAHWWAQRLSKMGHAVKLISPQFVKPFASRQKNDRNDARAILDASRSSHVRPTKYKMPKQQDLQLLLKIRHHVVTERVALGLQIESVLLEYGVIRKKGQSIADILEEGSNDLTTVAREVLSERFEKYKRAMEFEKVYDRKIKNLLQADAKAKKLLEMPGVGHIVAAAFLSAVSEADDFKCGRQVSAYFGLVPRQHSSGQSRKLLGITKTGNTYLRQTLTHGARSWVLSCKIKGKRPENPDNLWINQLLERKPFNVVCIAVANKMARRMWAVTKYA